MDSCGLKKVERREGRRNWALRNTEGVKQTRKRGLNRLWGGRKARKEGGRRCVTLKKRG